MIKVERFRVQRSGLKIHRTELFHTGSVLGGVVNLFHLREFLTLINLESSIPQL
jgi:hypothetical protein